MNDHVITRRQFIGALSTVGLGLAAFSLAGCGGSAGAASGSEGGATTIKVATTTGYKPYVYTDDNGELIGYDIELVKAVLDRLPQYKIEFVLNDWDSILGGLDSGMYQLSAECIFYSDERAQKYLYSDPISYDPAVAVTSVSHPDVKSFEDMAGETVSSSASNAFALATEKYNQANPDKKINLQYTEADYFQLFQNASEDKAILISDYGMANSLQTESGIEAKLNVLDKDAVAQYLDSTYTYFLLSRYQGNEQLLSDVNAALKQVMEDGTAKQISEKYFDGKDFTPVAN